MEPSSTFRTTERGSEPRSFGKGRIKLLAGAEIYGLPGVLVALPLLAASHAIWEFFAERVALEPWTGDEPTVAVDVEPARPVAPVPPSEQQPPAAATR